MSVAAGIGYSVFFLFSRVCFSSHRSVSVLPYFSSPSASNEEDGEGETVDDPASRPNKGAVHNHLRGWKARPAFKTNSLPVAALEMLVSFARSFAFGRVVAISFFFCLVRSASVLFLFLALR